MSIGIVGKDMEFTIYDDDDVSRFLEGLEERPQRRVSVTAVDCSPAGVSAVSDACVSHRWPSRTMTRLQLCPMSPWSTDTSALLPDSAEIKPRVTFKLVTHYYARKASFSICDC